MDTAEGRGTRVYWVGVQLVSGFLEVSVFTLISIYGRILIRITWCALVPQVALKFQNGYHAGICAFPCTTSRQVCRIKTYITCIRSDEIEFIQS